MRDRFHKSISQSWPARAQVNGSASAKIKHVDLCQRVPSRPMRTLDVIMAAAWKQGKYVHERQ